MEVSMGLWIGASQAGMGQQVWVSADLLLRSGEGCRMRRAQRHYCVWLCKSQSCLLNR